jgi:DNA primase
MDSQESRKNAPQNRLKGEYTSPMRYGQGLLEEILRRTDIVQLVGRRVKLVRKGRVMWGCCPFHKEKSPSFKVENERRTYKCFGCGKGGDAFKWLMETEGLSFPEAVERLAAEAGVELPKWTPEDEVREQQKKSLYDVIETACAFFEDQLGARAGAEARQYLHSRGLDGEAAKQFRIGYAPDSHGALKDHLTGKNISIDDMIAAGLVRPADGERGARDFFYDRIMFPIADPRGRVVAFGGRGLNPDAKPKYVNTGETSLFSKGRMLYNFAKARPVAIKEQNIVVAEGYMDVIALVRAGLEAAVAPLGTALTEDQLHLLWRVAAEPTLAFDGDEAGLRAAHRAARLALPHLKAGYSLRFAFLPKGEDPDSFIRASGPVGMRRILDAAEPLGQVLWRAETQGRDFSTPERLAGLERALGEIVQAIGDGKIADYYRRDFDNRVFETFKRRKPASAAQRGRIEPRGRGKSFPPRAGYASGPAVSAEVKNSLIARSGKGASRRIKEMELAVLLWAKPDIAAHHSEILAALPFQDRSLDRLRHELLNLAASGGRLETRALETHLVRVGLTELAGHLAGRASGEIASAGDDADRGHADAEDVEARWLRAANQLRNIAELDPERSHGQILLERRVAQAK